MATFSFSLCAYDLPLCDRSHAIFKIYILQGNVATRLRCGGIFNVSVIANFLEIVSVKEFSENW